MPCVKEIQHIQVAAVHEALKLLQADVAILVQHISLPQGSFHGVRYLHQQKQQNDVDNELGEPQCNVAVQ